MLQKKASGNFTELLPLRGNSLLETRKPVIGFQFYYTQTNEQTDKQTNKKPNKQTRGHHIIIYIFLIYFFGYCKFIVIESFGLILLAKRKLVLKIQVGRT